MSWRLSEIQSFVTLELRLRSNRKARHGTAAPPVLRRGCGRPALRTRRESPPHVPVVAESADSQPRDRAQGRPAAPHQAPRRAHAGGRPIPREARGILAAAERAAGLARGAAREESRKIVIGISPETDWAFLGKALRLFGEQAPSVEVLFQNLTPEAQIEALQGSRIDIGFVGLPIEAEGIVSEVTGRERLVAAIPEAHPMARQARIALRDLSGETYALWPRHLSPVRYDQLLAIFRRAGFGPPIAMEGGLPRRRPFSEWSRRD